MPGTICRSARAGSLPAVTQILDDSGLDFLGCDWHYSAHDDRLIADRLTSFIAGLPTGW